MSEQIIETIKNVNTAFSENRIEDFYAVCSDDVEWTMIGEKTVKGLDNIREWMKGMEGMDPPKINNHRIIADDNSAAAYGDMSMKTKDGDIRYYDYCDVYTFKNGKVKELRSFVIKTEPANAETKAAL